MEAVQHVPESELARDATKILGEVQGGRTALIESQGQPKAALIDIVDYRLLRAAVHYQSQPPTIEDPDSGLSEDAVQRIPDTQARYNFVVGYYLAGALSLSRAAELLDLGTIELRFRFHQLGIPLQFAPQTVSELRAEVEAVERWMAAEG